MRSLEIAGLALLALLTGAPCVGVAQAPDPLQRARLALREYDLGGADTTDVVASLTQLLATSPTGERAREARFLRAVVSADLWLLTASGDEGGVRARLAAAWGVAQDALPEAIRAELAPLRTGLYREAAEDAFAALDDASTPALPPEAPTHTRRQARVLVSIATQLAEAEDPAAVLAPLADDPCPGPAACEPPYVHFGPQGRRAIAAMTRIVALATAMERVAGLGDPFASAFRARHRAFAEPSLAPRDWGSRVAPASVSGRAIEADGAIVVAADHLRVGCVPTVRWDTDGRPQALASSAAILGSREQSRLIIARTLSSTAELTPLRSILERTLSGARRLAVIVEPGAEGRVLSIVLRTLQAAGRAPTALAAVAPEGTVHGVTVESVATSDPGGDESLGVFVREGGLTVRRRGVSTSLPRLRVGERWELDLPALARLAGEGQERRIGLRYMAGADASAIVRAALVAAGSERSVIVVP
jgi:hypothetical protein